MRDASLHAPSGCKPNLPAMYIWLSARLPRDMSALATTRKPAPLGVMCTSTICSCSNSPSFFHLPYTPRGSSILSKSTITRPFNITSLCLRLLPVKVPWNMNAGKRFFNADCRSWYFFFSSLSVACSSSFFKRETSAHVLNTRSLITTWVKSALVHSKTSEFRLV